jgi:hypothetical protein
VETVGKRVHNDNGSIYMYVWYCRKGEIDRELFIGAVVISLKYHQDPSFLLRFWLWLITTFFPPFYFLYFGRWEREKIYSNLHLMRVHKGGGGAGERGEEQYVLVKRTGREKKNCGFLLSLSPF